MKKYYIFSEVNGEYSYSVQIVEADSIKQAVEKTDGLREALIKDFNYNPKLDPSSSITIDFDKRNLFSEEELKLMNDWQNPKKKEFIVNNYERIVENARYLDDGISGGKFLETAERGWYDWIELYGNLPDGYIFSDGHDG